MNAPTGMKTGGLTGQKKSLAGQAAASTEYYSRNQRTKMSSVKSSPDNSNVNASQVAAANKITSPGNTTSKVGQKTATTTGFMQRRLSEEKKKD